jgi:hypothetical protein
MELSGCATTYSPMPGGEKSTWNKRRVVSAVSDGAWVSEPAGSATHSGGPSCTPGCSMCVPFDVV